MEDWETGRFNFTFYLFKRKEIFYHHKVVIGESFGVGITYDLQSLFSMYFVGTVGCFVWRCSR